MIICNFKDDFKNHVIRVFLSNNCKNWDQNKCFENLIIDYYNWQVRIIPIKKREVIHSPEINPPLQHSKGCLSLIKLIVDGGNINPYLSHKIFDISYQDKMLYDWGIYHFHLGNADINGEIDRTDVLLFARVTETKIYFIQYLKHGEWNNIDLIEAIHKHWPETIEESRVRNVVDVNPKLDINQRKILRNKNVNSFYQTKDGTVYAPIGGGLTTAGTSTRATLLAHRMLRDIDLKENLVHQNTPALLEKLIEKGHNPDQDYLCCWDVENNCYVIRKASEGSLGEPLLNVIFN